MNTTIELEKQILTLPAIERERLATFAWESLVNDLTLAGNSDFDPDGIKLAAERDAEIESGVVETINHAEFLRQTGGGPNEG